METYTKKEIVYGEGTFGHLIQNYGTVRFELPDWQEHKGEFGQIKEKLLGLCTNPGVKISSDQKAVINTFLSDVFIFSVEAPTIGGDRWVTINAEKELILATYINSLQK